MFDVGFSEIVLIGVVALLVTDPKDLPTIMYKAGRFFRQFKLIMSRVSDTVGDVMHELEVESYRQQYKQKPHEIDADRVADENLNTLPLPNPQTVDHIPDPVTTTDGGSHG